MKLDLDAPRVKSIEVFPKDPTVGRIGQKQQFAVIATYADGRVRDVTAEAFVESSNTEVATVDKTGLLTSRPPRRGDHARPLRGGLRRHHGRRHGRPLRVRLGARGRSTTTSTNSWTRSSRR